MLLRLRSHHRRRRFFFTLSIILNADTKQIIPDTVAAGNKMIEFLAYNFSKRFGL